MNCLFLDIASHEGTIALIGNEKVISKREVSTRVRDHELIPLVEECLEEAGWEYSDLTHLACVIGPGGFTSLRVAVSYSNTIIDQLEVEGVGVHLSDLHEARMCQDSESGIRNPDVLWLHATKRDLMFVRGFGEYEEIWREPTLISVDAFSQRIAAESRGFPLQWTGELLDSQKEALKELNLQEAELRSIEDILPKFVSGLTYVKKPLEPWYGRGF
ncbi:tRNA (adenosine(37)-N6)-threonylcarbamoyltransferase complex dimerization subunit type 1 TsaB [Patescibacteria group bacterium]|nr:tRNA (adenosine(37)-N6)-threonylcarbamoyltransferase complex dimerization subunit type 1 TsaB [Patescibacteria group bacterium]MBU1123567.1 tRNA (adenosine(37)-N6)-threonylcarbamoyltransferase complex dimerization subunit type 1 TsaB [Patescibacteria group bacterium]MBU1911309.1 tRNA (adenosine(37)-N6)-threonylcarbamoyltransferase complex dimerization subunit type 1 TsaB [Patescibacteria group bacterium]